MKTFERVLFLAGFLFIDVYTTRHIYQLWLAPTSSVLDEFRPEVEASITSAKDLHDLLAKYRPVYQSVRKLEEQNRGRPSEEWRFEDQAPFKSEATLRQAIEEWEQKQRDLFETRIYWVLGLITALVGFGVRVKASRWLGLALLITGFSEMIWWCSPAWFSRTTAETDRLLAHKLVLSVVTILFLVVVGRVLGLLRNEDSTAKSETVG